MNGAASLIGAKSFRPQTRKTTRRLLEEGTRTDELCRVLEKDRLDAFDLVPTRERATKHHPRAASAGHGPVENPSVGYFWAVEQPLAKKRAATLVRR